MDPVQSYVPAESVLQKFGFKQTLITGMYRCERTGDIIFGLIILNGCISIYQEDNEEDFEEPQNMRLSKFPVSSDSELTYLLEKIID